MGTHSPTEEHFINTTINQAMSDAGIAHDSPLKVLLARDASIETTARTAAVRVRDEQGQSVSVEERLVDMKNDVRYRHHFPKEPATVPASDLRATREHFDDIAAGRISVE